jgi:hypothetical protein
LINCRPIVPLISENPFFSFGASTIAVLSDFEVIEPRIVELRCYEDMAMKLIIAG